MVLAEECPNVVRMRKARNVLGLHQGPTLINQDSNGAIEWGEGGPAKHYVRCKHIDTRFYYVMGLVENGMVKLG